MSNSKLIFGEDLCNFIVLNSGHMAAEDFNNVFISIESKDSWDGERLNSVSFVLASSEEADEWWEKKENSRKLSCKTNATICVCTNVEECYCM